MTNFDLNSPGISFSDLAQHVISCVSMLAQKIGVHNDGPILDRLRQGEFVDSPSLISEIDPFVEGATSRLVEYNRHITQMEDALQGLKSIRDKFKRSMDVTMTLSAPVRRLPEDVLVEIFSIYIENSGLRSGSGPSERTYSFSLFPKRILLVTIPRIFSPNFLLSRICTFWRKVVFSRPSFWTSFSLDLRALRSWEKKGSEILTILSACLSRSADAPLSLSVELDSVGTNFIQEHALCLFLKQAARWKHLELLLPNWPKSVSHFISLWQSGEQPFIPSSLRHLRFGGDFASHATSLLPTLVRSTHLETLSTGSFELSWSDFCRCNLSSLKKLETVGVQGVSVGQFLGQMPSLEECNLTTTSGFTADEQPGSTFYSSSLRRLSVLLENCPVEAWQSLRAPSLNYLSLEAGDVPNIAGVSSMLLQSESKLQELRLDNFYDYEALEFIYTHPPVNIMTVSGSYNTDEFVEYPGELFACLTIREGEEILGRNLQSVAIEIDGKNTTSSLGSSNEFVQDIVEMVYSRSNTESLPPNVSILRKFSFTMIPRDEGVVSHIRTSLAPLEASGLQLQLD